MWARQFRASSRQVVTEDLQLVAQVLGLSVSQVRKEVSGRSFAHVARDYGRSPNALVDAFAARAMLRVSHAVEGGLISPEHGIGAMQRLMQVAAWRVHRPCHAASREEPSDDDQPQVAGQQWFGRSLLLCSDWRA